jgi:hypothetical protein
VTRDQTGGPWANKCLQNHQVDVGTSDFAIRVAHEDLQVPGPHVWDDG